MGDPGAPALDAEQIFRTLDEHGVDYLVVGGFAAVVYRADRLTFDIDIVPDPAAGNLEHLGDALPSLSAKLRIEDSEPVEDPLDAPSLAGMEVSPWCTSSGDVDIIRGLPKSSMTDLATYRDLTDRGRTVDAFGLKFHLASLDDIITSKIATNREPDRQALPEPLRLQNGSPKTDDQVRRNRCAGRSTGCRHPRPADRPLRPTADRNASLQLRGDFLPSSVAHDAEGDAVTGDSLASGLELLGEALGDAQTDRPIGRRR